MQFSSLASLGAFAFLAISGLTVACESAPAPPPALEVAADPLPEAEVPLGVFSADRAWDDLLALEALGPRLAGTEAAASARSLIAERLTTLGISFEIVETGEAEAESTQQLRHLVATLPGASPDLVVLVAQYDTSSYADIRFLGTNDGASGAALLIELTRVLSTRALPYTVRLVFLEGEGAAPGEERFAGSTGYANHLELQDEIEQVRLLVAFNQVCDADLQIARDLGSHRMHRDEFFKVARRMSLDTAFPSNQTFETVTSSHTAFQTRGVRPVVAIVDTRFGGSEVPGFYAATADDNNEHCSSESLRLVGRVTLETLESIGRRLAKIDRFTRAPLAPLEVTPESTPLAPQVSQPALEEVELSVPEPGPSEPVAPPPAS